MLMDRDVGKRCELPIFSTYLYIDNPKATLWRCLYNGIRREDSLLFHPPQSFGAKHQKKPTQECHKMVSAALRDASTVYTGTAPREVPWAACCKVIARTHCQQPVGSGTPNPYFLQLWQCLSPEPGGEARKLMLLQLWATRSKTVDPQKILRLWGVLKSLSVICFLS